MPAKSRKQQRIAGMAHSYLRGQMPGASPKVKAFAEMGRTKVRKFAKTKHAGLPKRVGRSARGRGY